MSESENIKKLSLADVGIPPLKAAALLFAISLASGDEKLMQQTLEDAKVIRYGR